MVWASGSIRSVTLGSLTATCRGVEGNELSGIEGNELSETEGNELGEPGQSVPTKPDSKAAITACVRSRASSLVSSERT